MSDFVIKAGMSVDTVLKNGSDEQKKAAKTFDADDNGIYDEKEASLFNSSTTVIKNENLEINIGKNKVELNGDYTDYRLKTTEENTHWDYSLLNLSSKSVIGFDKENKNASIISANYNPYTKEESVSIDNYGESNKIFTNMDGLYVSSGNSKSFSFKALNSRIRTIDTTNSGYADLIINNALGDGYGLSNGELTKKTSHKALVTESRKFSVYDNDSRAHQHSTRTLDDYIFFGKGFLKSVVDNKN